MAKTFSIKPSQIERSMYLIDAAKKPLGRVASVAAIRLMGKHKPSYTPHIDGGDLIVVINAEKIRLTGNKLTQKRYYRHSGYPGNLKSLTAEQMLNKNPAQVVMLAVKGMLPKNKLQASRLKRLFIYAGPEHPHSAQKPQILEVDNG